MVGMHDLCWSPDGRQIASTGWGVRWAGFGTRALGRKYSPCAVTRHRSTRSGGAPMGMHRHRRPGPHGQTVDPASGQETLTLRGHQDAVWGIYWHSDGCRLATGDARGNVPGRGRDARVLGRAPPRPPSQGWTNESAATRPTLPPDGSGPRFSLGGATGTPRPLSSLNWAGGLGAGASVYPAGWLGLRRVGRRAADDPPDGRGGPCSVDLSRRRSERFRIASNRRHDRVQPHFLHPEEV